MQPYDLDFPNGHHAGSYDRRTSFAWKFLRLVIILIVLVVLSWPFVEPLLLETDSVSLITPDLPAGIGQLRIVYVTDIHKGGLYTDSRLAGLISHINAASADLVLLGGDYADDTESAVAFFRTLPRIHARYGVYAVLGNHDRTHESQLDTLLSAMQSAHVTPLVNDVARVKIGMHSICIAGIDDPNNGRPDLKGVARQVSTDDLVIFLSHSPAVIPDALKAADKNGYSRWFDLGLFGHTHGGQVAWLGPLIKKTDVPKEYLKGWFRQSGANLLVSRGVGTSGLPVRLFCRPQIHVITLNAAK